MFRKIIPLNNKQASGYFLLISLYCFINGVSLTSLSLDANLYCLINVKCDSEFKYFITNNYHFKIKTILEKLS
jgi:hypothetical protein